MFGIAGWKWILAFVVFSVIGALGIPVLSGLALLAGLVPTVVIVLMVGRLFLGGFGGGSYPGTTGHDLAARNRARANRDFGTH